MLNGRFLALLLFSLGGYTTDGFGVREKKEKGSRTEGRGTRLGSDAITWDAGKKQYQILYSVLIALAAGQLERTKACVPSNSKYNYH